MKLIMLSLMLVPISMAFAETRMTGEEIYAALSGTTVLDEKTEQVFFKTGGTNYYEGKNFSYGKWRVSDDQYCSQWPPNEAWSCYDMFSDQKSGKRWIIFVGADGRRFETWIKQDAE